MAKESSKAAAETGELKCFLLQCPNEILLEIADYLKLAFLRTSHELHTILNTPFHDRASRHTYKNGVSVLEWAAEKDQAILIQNLQTLRSKKNFSTHAKDRALCIAADCGDLLVSRHCSRVEVSCLVSGVGPLRSFSTVKETPLRYAVGNHHFAIVELLLANGADLEAVDSTGYTALQYAVNHLDGTCVRAPS